MYQRQPHTHLTCGFCLQPKIIQSKPLLLAAGALYAVVFRWGIKVEVEK